MGGVPENETGASSRPSGKDLDADRARHATPTPSGRLCGDASVRRPFIHSSALIHSLRSATGPGGSEQATRLARPAGMPLACFGSDVRGPRGATVSTDCLTAARPRRPGPGVRPAAGHRGRSLLRRVDAWTGKDPGKRGPSRAPPRSQTSEPVPASQRRKGPGRRLVPGGTAPRWAARQVACALQIVGSAEIKTRPVTVCSRPSSHVVGEAFQSSGSVLCLFCPKSNFSLVHSHNNSSIPNLPRY